MKKFTILFFILITSLSLDAKTTKILSDQPIFSIRIHNEQGERIGTVKRENNVFRLYDMHERLVDNPAEFMKQPPNECYLFDVSGYAVGKCTSTRVIMWH